ncbi:MAG: squalene synthase HpnC [Mariprofundaceae bacterium]|nr:squalene synthase HpnC [Mariprofundaceae bacterium]
MSAHNSASTAPESSIRQAYQHCQEIAAQHYENFPTASKLIRADLRPAVAAIYAFARAADDMADEGDADAETRIKQLDAWESLLERCTKEDVDHPVFLALADAIKRFHLPTGALHDLLTAFRMDCTIHRYATEQELLFYCKHSANPVGRLMLALHGIHDAKAAHASDCICTALQLTNFWQDFSIDHPKGRCYLPESWLSAEHITSDALLVGEASHQQAAASIAHAIDFTRDLFHQGSELLPMLPLRFRLQIAATLHGGISILSATERCENPLVERPHLERSDWIQMILPIISSTLMPKRQIKVLNSKAA